MERMIRKLLTITAAVTAMLLWPCEAYAAGEHAHFGSESYEWDLGIENPIGVYAAADGNVESYDLTVTYDPGMLGYVSGGTFVEEGEVRVRGSSSRSNDVKTMLNFIPLTAGETDIQISGARITAEQGEETEADPVEVAVRIPVPESCRPEGMLVNGEEVPGFSWQTASYELTADEEAERADVTVLPESLSAEIENPDLLPGENDVYVVVSGDNDGERARYELHIRREEPEAVPAIQAETAPELEASREDPGTGERISGLMDRAYTAWKGLGTLWWVPVAIVFLTILLIGLIVPVVIQRRNRRIARERKRERRRRRPAQRQWDGNGEAPAVISVRNVTMDFKREKDESSSIKELMVRTLKRQRSREAFRALDDVSFTVRKGEVVGIIGTNGSGKSTILKIISGALIPTSGQVRVNRKKIQILTLGTGFDMELTGRENVYLNGALIGYTREFINEKYEEIVQFAELEGFMEERVKNYSSGMVSRLGFAIATAGGAAEILILDEVLSVGDEFFRKKSLERIKEMIHGGSTVLMVSHSMGTIMEHCSKAIWIEKGKLQMVGDPKEVCGAYRKLEK